MRRGANAAGLKVACFLAAATTAVGLTGARTAFAATAGEVSTFLGGLTGKVVYVDPTDFGKAYRLDLATMTATKISDDQGVKSPLISPDGDWITYQISSRSYIRRIDGAGSATQLPGNPAEAPHWYDDGSTVYVVHCSESDDIYSGGYTQIQELDGAYGVVGTAPQMLFASRAADGGRSADGRWLAEAYPLSFLYDMDNGNREYGWNWLRYTQGEIDLGYADQDELGNVQQTCNGSLSPDIGRNWRYMTLRIPHERVTIYKYDAAADRWIDDRTFLNPAGTQEWQHPEWSNHPDFATATAGMLMNTYKTYLMKTYTGEIIEVVSTDTDFPHMWVEATSPYMLLQPGDLTFFALQGGTSPASQTVVTSNWGSGTMGTPSAGTISYASGSGWLTVSGTTTLTASVNTSGLTTIGTYEASVPISASSATNSPRSLPVKLEFLAPDADDDGDGHSNSDEIAAGTNPLNANSYPPSSSNGCTASAGSGSSAIWLALALAGLAAVRLFRSRVADQA